MPSSLRLGLSRVLHLWLVFALAGCASTRELQPFATDGCSLFPDRDTAAGKDWRCCCVTHDVAYWRGGSADARRAADAELQACVRAATGDVALGRVMRGGVRVGGTPYLPTSFRWGYGWGYGRFYRPLTDEEQAQADALLRDAVAQPADACLVPAAAPASAPAAGR